MGWTVRHYRGGIYDVSTFSARLEREGFDGEHYAIYRHRETQQIWVRPVREFDDVIEVEGGMKMRRFEPVMLCEHCGEEDAPHPECQIAAAMTLTTEVVTQGRGGLHTWRCNRCCAHWTAHASRCPHCDDPETPQPAVYKPPHCGDSECEPCEEARLRDACPTCWKGTNPEIPYEGDVWRCPTCGLLYEEEAGAP
jgi:hypothetical protein